MNLTLICGCECIILVHGRGNSPLPWGEIIRPCKRHEPGNGLLNGEDQARHDAETG